jgi:hypothetical protein
MPVVVLLVFGKDLSGVGLVHDENVVEDLSADGADRSLAVGESEVPRPGSFSRSFFRL